MERQIVDRQGDIEAARARAFFASLEAETRAREAEDRERLIKENDAKFLDMLPCREYLQELTDRWLADVQLA